MPGFITWDVVIVPFPFTDQRATKVRPAVVVSTDVLSQHTGKYVLAMVTSASHSAHFGDVPVSSIQTAGLPAASVVRPSKLAVIEEADIIKRVGTLPHADRARVAAQLREFLAVGPA